jgi:hypothetical protein
MDWPASDEECDEGCTAHVLCRERYEGKPTIEIPALSMKEIAEQRLLYLQHQMLIDSGERERTPLLVEVERAQERQAVPEFVPPEDELTVELWPGARQGSPR